LALRTMDTLAFANLLLDVASTVNFIALLWMLRAVIKDRNVLRGFSIVGSFLTFISIVGFEFAYHLIGNVVGFWLGWTTVAFWFLVFAYSLRRKLRERKEKAVAA
jgi:apolipoprotein N-acyltransferase